MMLNNSWFKKEKPFLGLTGMGGGVGPIGAGIPGTFSASGGDIDASPDPNGYTYHVFFGGPGTSTFDTVGGPPTGTNVEFFVVAGGGDGGVCGGGGGGGGGILHHPGISIPSDPISFTVDAADDTGTTPSGSPCGKRSNGNNSTVDWGGNWTIVTNGGGAGGGADSQSGSAGGSGGGNSYPGGPDPTGPTATQPTQGQPGLPPGYNQYGNRGGCNPGPANGGGGSGGQGPSGTPQGGGPAQPWPGFAGPLPVFAPMPTGWKNATGPTGKYAGGGCGSPGPAPAEGGGGAGPSGAATDYTGGGGCGGDTATRGAKGIVIIRYLTP